MPTRQEKSGALGSGLQSEWRSGVGLQIDRTKNPKRRDADMDQGKDHFSFFVMPKSCFCRHRRFVCSGDKRPPVLSAKTFHFVKDRAFLPPRAASRNAIQARFACETGNPHVSIWQIKNRIRLCYLRFLR